VCLRKSPRGGGPRKKKKGKKSFLRKEVPACPTQIWLRVSPLSKQASRVRGGEETLGGLCGKTSGGQTERWGKGPSVQRVAKRGGKRLGIGREGELLRSGKGTRRKGEGSTKKCVHPRVGLKVKRKKKKGNSGRPDQKGLLLQGEQHLTPRKRKRTAPETGTPCSPKAGPFTGRGKRGSEKAAKGEISVFGWGPARETEGWG